MTPEHKVFKIYTEGIGSKTYMDEFNDINYKGGDTIGYAMGTTALYQNTGIKTCERFAAL